MRLSAYGVVSSFHILISVLVLASLLLYLILITYSYYQTTICIAYELTIPSCITTIVSRGLLKRILNRVRDSATLQIWFLLRICLKLLIEFLLPDTASPYQTLDTAKDQYIPWFSGDERETEQSYSASGAEAGDLDTYLKL
ncbi:hypothetical protein BHM03_00010536 [Ensete ventricosum]|nr:hypothetical protein BHM03_00010536 [Ensete ventricosum]